MARGKLHLRAVLYGTYAVQYISHWLYVATEHLKSGYYWWGNKFITVFLKNKIVSCGSMVWNTVALEVKFDPYMTLDYIGLKDLFLLTRVIP